MLKIKINTFYIFHFRWLIVFFNRKSLLSESDKKKDAYLRFRDKVPQWAKDDNLTEPNEVKAEYEEMGI